MKTRAAPEHVLNLRMGEVVEVRSQEEILATLDSRGEYECLPFMPEMLRFCGQRFTVLKLAVKVCETVKGTGMHRMRNTVVLEGTACDGSAHGGCQAACLILWKEAWLKRPGPTELTSRVVDGAPAYHNGHDTRGTPATIRQLMQATRKTTSTTSREDEVFSCQMTELPRAMRGRVPWWSPSGYIRDVRAGNATPYFVLRCFSVAFFNKYQGFSRRYLPKALQLRRAKKYPFINGKLTSTPLQHLNLRPGDCVQVKSAEEIFATLDVNAKNRGLRFDGEMLQWCGKELRVAYRLEKIIDEQTGRMKYLKNPSIVLEGVICTGRYNQCCARCGYPYWRELWLKRLDNGSEELDLGLRAEPNE